MLNKKEVPRREFICSAATMATAAAMGISQAETTKMTETSRIDATGAGTKSDYARVRGFNYQPSYGSHGLETWGDAFDIAVFKRELLLGRTYFPGMNTVRLWLSYDAFIRQPEKMPERFHRVIDLADELGVRFIPMLFNGWHSCPDFGGISVEMLGYWGAPDRFNDAFGPYIDAILKPHAEDGRILLWDLCNEPFNSAMCGESKKIILDWLERVHARAKECASAPISVGSVPGMDSIRTLEPLSDVITFHPYYAWNAWVPAQQFEPRSMDSRSASQSESPCWLRDGVGRTGRQAFGSTRRGTGCAHKAGRRFCRAPAALTPSRWPPAGRQSHRGGYMASWKKTVPSARTTTSLTSISLAREVRVCTRLVSQNNGQGLIMTRPGSFPDCRRTTAVLLAPC